MNDTPAHIPLEDLSFPETVAGQVVRTAHKHGFTALQAVRAATIQLVEDGAFAETLKRAKEETNV